MALDLQEVEERLRQPISSHVIMSTTTWPKSWPFDNRVRHISQSRRSRRPFEYFSAANPSRFVAKRADRSPRFVSRCDSMTSNRTALIDGVEPGDALEDIVPGRLPRKDPFENESQVDSLTDR